MKLGFWTLYDVDWTNAEIARKAADLGYQGVDLRVTAPGRNSGMGENLTLQASQQDIDDTKRVFAEAGVEISSLNCYNSSPTTIDTSALAAFESEIRQHAELARKLRTPRVRFQLTAVPASGIAWETYLDHIWDAVGHVLDAVSGINAVVENHPDRANAEQLLATAQRKDDPRIGVEFSPDHAVVMQENVFDLIERYTPYIHQICYADRKLVQEDLARFDGRYYYLRYESCWIGDGAVPGREMLSRLAQHGFDDYVSLKWEKSARFGHHLPSSESALEHFPSYMRQLGVPHLEVASR
ncbi:MAG: sugar phosphate isomerase/epimerase [Chloroflexi bacterium]|nr:sugar phosphate isomerase/epimerase [Chloroflexota bacterium]